MLAAAGVPLARTAAMSKIGQRSVHSCAPWSRISSVAYLTPPPLPASPASLLPAGLARPAGPSARRVESRPYATHACALGAKLPNSQVPGALLPPSTPTDLIIPHALCSRVPKLLDTLQWEYAVGTQLVLVVNRKAPWLASLFTLSADPTKVRTVLQRGGGSITPHPHPNQKSWL